MASAKSKIDVVPSSGNVFTDLRLPNAEEKQTKVRLAVAINQRFPRVVQVPARRLFCRTTDEFSHSSGPRRRYRNSTEAEIAQSCAYRSNSSLEFLRKRRGSLGKLVCPRDSKLPKLPLANPISLERRHLYTTKRHVIGK